MKALIFVSKGRTPASCHGSAAGRPFALLEGNTVLHSIAKENKKISFKRENIYRPWARKTFFASKYLQDVQWCSAAGCYRSSEFHLPGQNGCRTALKGWPQWEFTGLLYGRKGGNLYSHYIGLRTGASGAFWRGGRPPELQHPYLLPTPQLKPGSKDLQASPLDGTHDIPLGSVKALEKRIGG